MIHEEYYFIKPPIPIRAILFYWDDNTWELLSVVDGRSLAAGVFQACLAAARLLYEDAWRVATLHDYRTHERWRAYQEESKWEATATK